MRLHILRWKSFLPHQKVFTPLLTSWKSEKLKNLKIRFVASSAQKGGKKLSEGVKNFFMMKSNVSAFSWTKNDIFIWQIHSYSSDQTTAAKSQLGVRSGVSPLNVYILPKLMKIREFWNIRYESIFEQSIWFLIEVKVEIHYFGMIKVFTPLKSFLPPFLRIENPKIVSFQKSIPYNSDAKRGGKKLLNGVKNFLSKFPNFQLSSE